jgi:hypothetical protein
MIFQPFSLGLKLYLAGRAVPEPFTVRIPPDPRKSLEPFFTEPPGFVIVFLPNRRFWSFLKYIK